MTITILVILMIVAVDISGSKAKTFTPPESVVERLPFNNQNNSKDEEIDQRIASKIEISEDQIANDQDNKEAPATGEDNKENKNPEVKSAESANSSQTETDQSEVDPAATPSDQQATKEVDTKTAITPTAPMSTPSPTPSTSPDTDNSCTASGGAWREFPNSCVDSCALAENPGLMCLQVITEGCDCGPNKCWDREANSCVDNPSGVKIISPTIRIQPPVR